MKVISVYNIFGNDCTMEQECEHCGHIEVDKSAYNDHYFIHKVIPGRFCKICDKNQAGQTEPVDK